MGLAAVDAVENRPLNEDSLAQHVPVSESVGDHFPSLSDQVVVASFAALNLLLGKLILSLDYFAPVQTELSLVWAVLLVGLSTFSLAFCFPPLLAAAARDIRSGYFSVEVAKAIVLSLSAFALVYALFFDFPRIQFQFLYESLPVLILALTVEQYLFVLFERKAVDNSEFSLLRLCQKVRRLEPYPDHAPVEAVVSADVIKPGELFKLGVGEFVPCDGLIIEGLVELRERRYSGLPVVKFKSKGHKIFAGSEVVQGEVLCEAAALADDSTITSFTHLLNERVRQGNDKFDDAKLIESRAGMLLVAIAVCLGTYVSGAGANIGVVASILACVLSAALLLRAARVWAYLPGLIHTTAFRKGMLFKDAAVVNKLAGTRNFVVDFNLRSPPGRVSILALEIVDERIERNALLSVLLALFGGSEDEFYTVATEHLRKELPTPTLHKASDVRIYEGRGLSGNVGGVEFTVGSEGFLIERGVYVQASEIIPVADREYYVYIAMHDEIVARFKVAGHFTADGRALRERLTDLQVHPILCSLDGTEEVDKAGKRAGFELPAIFGGLSEEQYLEKMKASVPAALLVGDSTPPSVIKEAASTISFFDDVRWNLDRSDVVLLSPSLSRVSEMFLISRLSKSVRMTGLLMLLLSFAVAAGLAAFGFPVAGLLAPVLILGMLLVYLNQFRLLLP
ncbi:MAG: cation-translocating P-type ATPase [Deltaproteobacteria bacterium]|nr:cation-translocating P-type ATPase [Deltaproteobacteria bacterium]